MITNDQTFDFNQILPTRNIRNIRRIVRRIWMLILGLKELKLSQSFEPSTLSPSKCRDHFDKFSFVVH